MGPSARPSLPLSGERPPPFRLHGLPGAGRDGDAERPMTAVLGISAFYHDSAAALVVDGEVVAAAQEERFSRIKHDHSFPHAAIEYCLAEGGLGPRDLDYVGFYDKPLLKFDRLLETYLAHAPRGFGSFLRAIPLWTRHRLHIPKLIRRGLHGEYTRRVVFCEHHESHAASAFFPSPFQEAAVLTLDGVGEWATASLGVGRGNRIALSHELRFPHSLGLLYSAFTYFCGFKVNSGEYKLMGLAPYGMPRYADLILDELVDLKDDGSFRLHMRYFNYCQGLTMTSRAFEELFGGPPRRPEAEITEREMDMAASIQFVTEEIMLGAARYVHRLTGRSNLCLAGGVALNCVGNGRILREGPFERLWIQPAAGDAGGALGVALFIWYQLLGHPRDPVPQDSQRGSLLGPRFSSPEVMEYLERAGAVWHRLEEREDLYREVARLVDEGRVVGFFQGRMEFGPRALGSRSILGDARDPEMQSVMNLKIKFRESFRPFAPAVLRERCAELFDMPDGGESPYMLLVLPIGPEFRLGNPAGARGLERLRARHSTIPAVTHVDFTARVQTVDLQRHEALHGVLKAFEARTGCPVLINTSFNVRGEPIVCTPAEAYHCFMNTGMDALVLEDFILLKPEQPQVPDEERRQYLSRFELD